MSPLMPKPNKATPIKMNPKAKNIKAFPPIVLAYKGIRTSKKRPAKATEPKPAKIKIIDLNISFSKNVGGGMASTAAYYTECSI